MGAGGRPLRCHTSGTCSLASVFTHLYVLKVYISTPSLARKFFPMQKPEGSNDAVLARLRRGSPPTWLHFTTTSGSSIPGMPCGQSTATPSNATVETKKDSCKRQMSAASLQQQQQFTSDTQPGQGQPPQQRRCQLCPAFCYCR